MKTLSGCPAPEELRDLLAGSLSGDRQQQCTQHMDTCRCCQTRLEEIATEGTNLSHIVKQLKESEPDATSAYWPALQSLADGAQAAGVAQSSNRTRELSLRFLQPASDNAYLGRLAHFDVMRVLGRGGMGVVFEAFDSRLQRNVALKVLDPELAGDEVARQRFCREARAAASITHENVVAVHQVEKAGDDSLPYLVMQVVAGESLEQRLAREGKLSVREVVRIGMQAAHGLEAAHSQGLIHRDIKPGNILLEAPHDRVKLTDFGLARVADDAKLTQTGFVSGTPLYMAPEQALGEESDHRSDLFSLGAILYEMCAGQTPFTGNSALAILKQIVDARPRPLRELNPTVPDWLSKTIDRLLAKKPGDRIQSAAQLAELLEFQWAILKTSSDDVPTVCEEEARKRKRRHRWMAAAIGSGFLVLGLLGGLLLANRSSSTVAPVSDAEPVAVLSASAGAVRSVSFDPSSNTVAMGVDDGSVRLWDLPTKSVKSTFEAHRGLVWLARFAHQGELLATAGDDGLVKLWKPGEAQPIRTFTHRNAVRGLALAHDDRTLFAGDREGLIRAWSIDSGESLADAEQPGAIHAVAISPDDQTLATAGSDKVVRLWNAKTLAQKIPLEGQAGPTYGLAFNHDGRRLASVGWDRTVRIWDTGSGLLVKSWDGHGGDIWSVAYSHDGARLATGSQDGAVKLWDAGTGKLLATYLGHDAAIHVVTFNSDGKLLASGGRDGAVRIWKVE